VHTFGGVLIGLGIAVGFIAVVWLGLSATRRSAPGTPGLADIAIAHGTLIVAPRGAWRMLALTRAIEVPLSQVVGCDADPDPRSSHPVAMRVGGTGFPGRVRAGYMVGADGRSWWLYRYGENAVVIELAGNRLAYLVVEVDDPTAVVDAIRHAAAAAQR